MNPRHLERQGATALAALTDVLTAVNAGHPADVTFQGLVRQHKEWGSRDRRLLGAVIFSYFRWRGWLMDRPLPEAAALAYALDALEPHGAMTALAGREIPAWGALPLPARRDAFAQFTGTDPQFAALVPAWLNEVVAAERVPAIIASLQVRPPTWLRATTGYAEALLSRLTALGESATPHPTLSQAVSCSGGARLAEVRGPEGVPFEVQDIASQAVGLICAPEPGQRWWDMCAGSGGKSLHLADLLQQQGEIVATDVRENALQELARRVRAANCSIVTALPIRPTPSGWFDGVLVDAPCSGLGTWSRNPDMRWRTSRTDVTQRAEQQLELLERAADSVRPGGVLVYAVCTFTQEETTHVVEAFGRSRQDFQLDPFASPLHPDRPASGVLQLWPEDGPGDGMFMARFRRQAAG